jgi:hypothetical protein
LRSAGAVSPVTRSTQVAEPDDRAAVVLHPFDGQRFGVVGPRVRRLCVGADVLGAHEERVPIEDLSIAVGLDGVNLDRVGDGEQRQLPDALAAHDLAPRRA